MDEHQLQEIPFSRTTLYDGAIFRVETWQVTCPDGRTALREIVLNRGAAAVVPVFADGTTLLVRQYRVSIGRTTLEIPAGKLDHPHEDPLDCAIRELSEETGLIADRITLLCPLLTTPGFCNEQVSIYLAQGLTQADIHPDDGEFLSLVRMPLDEAVGRVRRGEIRDSKTVCGLLLAQAALHEGGRA